MYDICKLTVKRSLNKTSAKCYSAKDTQAFMYVYKSYFSSNYIKVAYINRVIFNLF